MKDTEKGLDITSGVEEKKDDFETTITKTYSAMAKNKTLKSFEDSSAVVLAAQMHQHPMDPPEVQAERMKMIMALPDPTRVWLLYYQGGYMKKNGLKRQSSAEAPGEILLVKKQATENFDITEE